MTGVNAQLTVRAADDAARRAAVAQIWQCVNAVIFAL